MMSLEIQKNTERLAKTYGYQIPNATEANKTIEDYVNEGKLVGEWNEIFKIYGQAELMNKKPIRWKKDEALSDCLNVDEVKNLWQALDYFSEGELDVLFVGESMFLFPQEGRRLIEAIRNPNLKTDYNFDSDDAFLNNLQGKLLVLEGSLSEAGKSFGKSLAALPEFSEPYANLGALLWQLGQKREAFTLFIEALIRNPRNISAQLNFFDAGRELQEFESMVKVIEALLEIDSECLEFYPVLAFSYFRCGQKNKAIEILNQLIAKHPEEEEAQMLLKKIESEVQ